jgi:aspartyl-tRNA(Asn)/glutamyl-tRNA(Gln) amidotransferase subunit C
VVRIAGKQKNQKTEKLGNRKTKKQKSLRAGRQGGLTAEEVRKIARLARLELMDKEVENLGKQLSETVGYVEVLEKLDTSGVEPTFQVTKQVNRWREDEVKPSLSQEEALSGSKRTHRGYFVVPYVFGSNGSS